MRLRRLEPPAPAAPAALRLRLQQDRSVCAPAHEHLVTPVYGRLRCAALVLRKDRHQLAGRGPDPVRRAVAEVAELPHRAAQLIDAHCAHRLLAETYLLRPQRHPHALTDRETPLGVDHELTARFGAIHRDQTRLTRAHR